MKKIYEPIVTIGSGLVQAAASILIIKLNLSNLNLSEVQVWILILAVLQFYVLIEFGATSVLPRKLTTMEKHISERYVYLRRYINRAMIFHIASIPFIFLLFIILMHYGSIMHLSYIQLFMLSLVVILRAYTNINFGIIYSLGKNILEKEIRLISSLASVAILYFLGAHNGYTLDDLFIVIIVTSVFTLFGTFYYLKNIHKNVNFAGYKSKYFEKMSAEEIDTVKTSLPAMFVINTLPFTISIFLTARDNVNFAIAQQIYGGLGIFILAPIVIFYKNLTILFFTKFCEAKPLLLRAVFITTLMSVSFQVAIAFTLDYALLFLSKDKNLIDQKFIIFFLALMSFEWIQTVMTRGAMAAGHYDFWRQTAASAVLTLVLTLLFIPHFGLYGLICAVTISQIPTCHYFNIKIALEKYQGKFIEFFRTSSLYYCLLPFFLFYSLK